MVAKSTFPATPREMFHILADYDRSIGLESLLERLDYRDLSFQQIYWSALGRAPTENEGVASSSEAAARELLPNLLRSAEFRNKVVSLILQAFPEKKRSLFIHIPKCAGSSLKVFLQQHRNFLDLTLLTGGFLAEPDFFEGLREFHARAQASDTVYLGGHLRLSEVMSEGMIRSGDFVYTTIRDPQALMLSWIGYLVSLLKCDPGGTRPDTKEILARHASARAPAFSSKDWIIEFARSAIRDDVLIPPNPICLYLGRGECQSALDNCIASGIEIVPTVNFNDWVAQKWGVLPSRVNVGEDQGNLLTSDAVLLDLIQEKITEDRRFYLFFKSRAQQTKDRGFRIPEAI